eukprot:3371339-Rhodomonas_salina.1
MRPGRVRSCSTQSDPSSLSVAADTELTPHKFALLGRAHTGKRSTPHKARCVGLIIRHVHISSASGNPALAVSGVPVTRRFHESTTHGVAWSVRAVRARPR